jgi:branched-chain amino acid transport system substrate-binding protein
MTIKRSRAQSAPVRIGFLGELSGPAAPVGLPNRLGAEAARNYINQNGGINGRQLELVELDDAGNPNNAVSIARQFASQGINLIVGPSITSTALAVSSLLPDLKCVGIFMGTPEIRFTHELFNRNLFVTSQNNYTREHEIAEFMATRYPNISAWTGAIPDVAAGHGGWAAFVQGVKDIYPKIAKHDVTIIDPALSKFGATDYKTQISELVASPATGFWTMLFGSDGITFYQQGQQFGLGKKFKAMVDYGIDIDLPKTLKRNVPTNVWTSSYWYYGATIDSPMTKETVHVFTAANDPYPHGFAMSGHAPVMAYAAAIKASGSTETDEVIAAIEGLEFETLTGACHYRKEDHQLVSRSYMVRWEPTEADPGWKAAEFAAIEDADVINSAAPGTKWPD